MNKRRDNQHWQRVLTAEQYAITRLKGTEYPFSGALLHEHRAGSYHCVCCGELLFHADHKFDAGCGWPSFYAAEPAQVAEQPDHTHGMIRTEILCQHCDAHLGHVFDDGPAPTGLRYCVNSLSMVFKPKE